MTRLWERMTRVDARVWFGYALAATASGYVVREMSYSPWLVVHVLILACIWHGSRNAWALLVTLTAVYATVLVSFGIASLFTSTLTVETNGWSLAADVAALGLLAAFRGSRLRALRAAPTHPEPTRATA